MKPARIDTRGLALPKPGKRRKAKPSTAYRDYLHTRSCIVSGQRGTERDPVIQAHLHLSGTGGTGKRPEDRHSFPLRQSLHRRQHAVGECAFWLEVLASDKTLLAAVMTAYAEKLYREWENE